MRKAWGVQTPSSTLNTPENPQYHSRSIYTTQYVYVIKYPWNFQRLSVTPISTYHILSYTTFLQIKQRSDIKNKKIFLKIYGNPTSIEKTPTPEKGQIFIVNFSEIRYL